MRQQYDSLVYDPEQIRQHIPEGFMHEFPIIQQFVKAAETKGLERGTEQTLTTIAIAMLNDNQPIDTIVKYTGLSEEAIKQLIASVRSTT